MIQMLLYFFVDVMNYLREGVTINYSYIFVVHREWRLQ